MTKTIDWIGKFLNVPNAVEKIEVKLNNMDKKVVLKETCQACHEGTRDRIDTIIEMLRDNGFRQRQPKKD